MFRREQKRLEWTVPKAVALGVSTETASSNTERGAADAPSRYVLPTYVCKQVLNEIKTEHRVSGMRDE